jgi:hypothetical protein
MSGEIITSVHTRKDTSTTRVLIGSQKSSRTSVGSAQLPEIDIVQVHGAIDGCRASVCRYQEKRGS